MRPYVAPRLAVAVALSLSLAAPAHAAGGPIPSKPSRPMANVPLVEPAEAAAINASVLGGIGVSLTEDAALAAGGDGVLRLELPSAQPATMSTRDTRVRVHVPEPYTIDGVNARGWRCMRRGGGLGCSMARAVDAGSHPPIELRVDADPGGDDGSDALVTADASWRQSGRQQYNAHGSERLVARTGLGVTASTANATVLGPVAGSTPTPVVLGGHLARFIDGIPADYNWKQLDGPAVQWEGPSSGAATSEDVSARFTPPALTKPATLHFELTVSDWRG